MRNNRNDRGAAPEEEELDKYLLYVVSTHALVT